MAVATNHGFLVFNLKTLKQKHAYETDDFFMKVVI